VVVDAGPAAGDSRESGRGVNLVEQRGLAARVLSSPRRRRRLRLGAVVLALAGVCTFLGIQYSNTGKRFPDHFRAGPAQRVAPPLKAAKLSAVDAESVRRITELFIDTAVLRQRVDDSWDITTRKLRQGLTRKQWDLGNIPVTPFQADAVGEIKYDLEWSGETFVYVKIAIVPKPTSNADGQAFDIGLRRKGDPAEHRWLVDYWVPAGIGVAVNGPRARARAAAQAVTQPSSRIPVAYVFVPVGLLVAFIVGLPIAIFGRQWLRGRRAVREFERERA